MKKELKVRMPISPVLFHYGVIHICLNHLVVLVYH